MHLLCHDDAVKEKEAKQKCKAVLTSSGVRVVGLREACFCLFSWFSRFSMKCLCYSGNRMKCWLVTKSCPTFVTPRTVAHQALLSPGFPRPRILGWVASFSRGSSRPRDQTCVSCAAGRFFTAELPRKPHKMKHTLK